MHKLTQNNFNVPKNRSLPAKSTAKQGIQPPPDNQQHAYADKQADCFVGVEEITHGKSDSFNPVPGIHRHLGITIVAGNGTHGKRRAGKHQNDKRNDQYYDINLFHSCNFKQKYIISGRNRLLNSVFSRSMIHSR